MPATREIILPTGAVHERLGISVAPTVRPPTRIAKIDIRRLNITDPGPTFGRWIDLEATLKWMRQRSMEAGGVAILERMADELAEVTS